MTETMNSEDLVAFLRSMANPRDFNEATCEKLLKAAEWLERLQAPTGGLAFLTRLDRLEKAEKERDEAKASRDLHEACHKELMQRNISLLAEIEKLKADHEREAGLWDEQHTKQHRMNTELAKKLEKYEG